MEFDTILFQLVVIFAGAAVFATVFVFLRQPIIVAYIALGMAIGPHGLRVLTHAEYIEEIAHLGIILLLFLIGLNLHPHRLITLFRKTALVSVGTCSAFALLIGGTAMLFGFGLPQSAVIGAALMFSSTIVGLKLTPTTTLHQKRLGEIMVSVLLLQDIIAIALIILLEGKSGPDIRVQVPVLMLKGVLLSAAAFVVLKHGILRVLRRYDTIQEYVLVVALGWCLAVAGLARVLGLSYAIGAFIAGCSFAISPISLVISEKLKSLREFFLILFFFGIGAQFDLLVLQTALIPSVVLALGIVIVKPLLFGRAFAWTHEKPALARELGFRLGQASEFSLLVAYVALDSGALARPASYLIQVTTIITLVISTYVVSLRYQTPIAANKKLRVD